MTDVARNARQVSRTLDGILQNLEGPIDKGIPLETLNHGEATGRLFIQTKPFDVKLPMLPQGKADNQILSVVEGLKESVKDRDVVLVSKDINMRLKAAALNLVAEDYYNDKMIEDSDILRNAQAASQLLGRTRQKPQVLAERRSYLVSDRRVSRSELPREPVHLV